MDLVNFVKSKTNEESLEDSSLCPGKIYFPLDKTNNIIQENKKFGVKVNEENSLSFHISDNISEDLIQKSEENIIFIKNNSIPPNNEIWYKTTNNQEINIIIKYPNDFINYEIGYQILSSSYSDGIGKIVFSEDIKYIGGKNNIEDEQFLLGPLFTELSTLEEIYLPNSLTEIGDYSFSGCTSLTTVINSKTIKRIGKYAFYNTGVNINSIINNDNIIEIDDFAFGDCSSSGNFLSLPKNKELRLGEYCFKNINYKIISFPNRCSISSTSFWSDEENSSNIKAFLGNDGIIKFYRETDINTVNEIYLYCGTILCLRGNDNSLKAIKSIKNSPSLNEIRSYVAITDVQDYAFQYTNWDNTVLTYFSVLGSDISLKIGKRSFYKNNITQITLPPSLVSLGDEAFKECSGLTKVIFDSIEYTSKSSLETAIRNNGTILGENVFAETGLSS